MFDFAFSELALIGVVALVVIGPERLPRVARTAGVVVGRLQRYAATVRADIEREVEMSELRRVQADLKDAARSLESGVRDSLATAESHFEESKKALMTAVPGADATALPSAAAPLAGAPHPDVPAPAPAPAPQASLFSPAEAPPGDSAEPPAGHA
jgi:sec-independent protein translocase protein TatB